VVHWRMIFGKAGADGNKKRKGRLAPPFQWIDLLALLPTRWSLWAQIVRLSGYEVELHR